MPTAAPALSDDRLVEMLSLMQDSDSVELKLTIPESAQRSTVLALAERDIKLSGAQTTKTRKALQYFSKQSSRA